MYITETNVPYFSEYYVSAAQKPMLLSVHHADCGYLKAVDKRNVYGRRIHSYLYYRVNLSLSKLLKTSSLNCVVYIQFS